MSKIVVGIDASDHAISALRWALDEARLRDATVTLAHAYPTPELTAMPAIVTLPSEEELRDGAVATLEAALEAVGGPGVVDVEMHVEAGGAARVLIAAAEGADLLVIGARGFGGFRGLLLGSVSQQAVAHSPCPVVVVPPKRA